MRRTIRDISTGQRVGCYLDVLLGYAPTRIADRDRHLVGSSIAYLSIGHRGAARRLIGARPMPVPAIDRYILNQKCCCFCNRFRMHVVIPLTWSSFGPDILADTRISPWYKTATLSVPDIA
eukprot:3940236-Rhodomonas_salina.4